MNTRNRNNIAALALVASALLATPLIMSSAARAEEAHDKAEWKGSIAAEEHVAPARMAEMAKIPLAQAIATALDRVAGKAIDAELESEDGFLIYGIEIVTPEGKVKEVIVDPGNGKVLGVEDEESHEKGEKDED